MKSIVFNGHDFSRFTCAKVLEKSAHKMACDTATVPGRPGELLVGGRALPRTIKVKLVIDTGLKYTTAQMNDIRHMLLGWLHAPKGAELELPDEPDMSYRNVVCVDGGEWDTLFGDGTAVLEFIAYDPIAYGKSRYSTRSYFTVKGNWDTWPTIKLLAAGGETVKITDNASGKHIELAGDFKAGDVIKIDCENEVVTVNGSDASTAVTLSSDFFALSPGDFTSNFTGVSSSRFDYVERWV